jgi:hypothetical protein
MTRVSPCLSACVSLLMGCVTPALGVQVCKPVVGSFEATVVPPGQGHCPPVDGLLCTAGRVWGGIQGTYRFVITGGVPSGVGSILFFTGTSTVSLTQGAQLLGTDTGSVDLPPGIGGFASLITFDAGAGQIRLRGEFNAAQATTTGDYIGTLCTG